MDAIRLLKQDHERMKELLEEAQDTSRRDAQQRRELLQQIKHDLRTHERMEETVLYPELRRHKDAKEIVLEGFEEHHAADLVLDELMELPAGHESWKAKAKVLQEMIEHHIEEEEGEMFPKAEKLLGSERLEEMGRRMERIKQQGPEYRESVPGEAA